MTPEQLKSSILQYAIQGKLVEQRREDGTAEELFQQIQEEKHKLIKEGKMKKEKSLTHISEDEIPFDIPDTWRWSRIGDVYALTMGQSPDGKSVSKGFDGMEFHQGKVFFGEDYILKSDQVTSEPSKIAEPNSVLLCVRAPVGIVNITDRELCIGRGLCALKPLAGMTEKYALYSLRCLKDTFIKKATGTTFVAITGEVVKNQIIPLPPLEEQHRIVAKIEELLPYVDRYAKAYEKLEQLNSKFPEDMKKSILQYAVQGKLVEQRPEEGTAEEQIERANKLKIELEESGILKGRKTKNLLSISDDIPFDIPETWRWIRLGSITEIFGRIGFRGYTKNDIVNKGEGAITMSPSNISQDTGEIDFSESTYLSWEKYDESPEIMLEIGDIVLVKTGSSYGKCGIIKELPEKATINPQLAILKYIACDKSYLNIVLKSPMARSQYEQFVTGTSIPTFSQEKLSNMYIPLPPLEEQRRIVTMVEELLPICEGL